MKLEIIESFPQWALGALINGDYQGLSEDDKAILDAWLDRQEYVTYTTLTEDHEDYSEGYFTWNPAFGIEGCACETIIGILP